jgi:hypothetical protein
MRTGYAAFLDVMGFSALVSGDGHAERINNYLGCLRDILEISGGYRSALHGKRY